MSKMKTLNDGLLDGLKDLYSAESQLLKALPKMEKKATNEQLKKLFLTHQRETEEQVERLQEISNIIGSKLTGKTCKAMQGLIEEGSEALEEESENDALIDSLIAGAALRVECYEIAAYESAIGMATEVGQGEIVKLLEETLSEEKDSYGKLTKVCKQELFPDAHLGEGDESAERSEKRKTSKSDNRSSSTGMRASGAAKLAIVLAMGASLVLPLPNAGAQDSVGNPTGNGNRDGTSKNMEHKNSEASRYDVDNTGRNVRDADDMSRTADSQKLTGNDTQVLAQIRRRIVANDNISTYGKNIKIIVENGAVTLRGPVKSSDERTWIERTATESASGYRVINQLEVDRG